MDNTLKCPFKNADNADEKKECDREKCVLWHEGGCAFIHLVRELGILNETMRNIQSKY